MGHLGSYADFTYEKTSTYMQSTTTLSFCTKNRMRENFMEDYKRWDKVCINMKTYSCSKKLSMLCQCLN